MEMILFIAFSAIMLTFGVMVVSLRSPVSSALSLVGCFVALAALFVTLDAFFIAVIQILVYAGAVMVLFLFIIMLLDLRAEELRKPRVAAYIGGGGVFVSFVIILMQVLMRFEAGGQTMPALSKGAPDDVKSLGLLLFTDYNLPFQIVGVLILVASVGVVILSKRDLS